MPVVNAEIISVPARESPRRKFIVPLAKTAAENSRFASGIKSVFDVRLLYATWTVFVPRDAVA